MYHDPEHREIASLYREAANLIRTRGHAKEQWQTSDGAFCMVGALAYVGGHSEYDAHDNELVDKAIWLLTDQQPDDGYDPPYDNLTQWNDEEETTAEQVIARLEQAAVKLQGGI